MGFPKQCVFLQTFYVKAQSYLMSFNGRKNMEKNISEQRKQFLAQIKELGPGQNLLVVGEDEKKLSLLKYEACVDARYSGREFPVSRNLTLSIIPPGCDDVNVKERDFFGILATHRLNFSFDPKLRAYLPSSDCDADLYVPYAQIYKDGREEALSLPQLITEDTKIWDKFVEATIDAVYIQRNIDPFLDARPTGLKVPDRRDLQARLSRLFFGGGDANRPRSLFWNRAIGAEWLAEATKNLEEGEVVYIGAQNEVWLGQLVLDERRSLVLDRNSLFRFSNEYLGPYGSNDRDSRIPTFAGLPFVFSGIGYGSPCKHPFMMNEPQIITGDGDLAGAHFWKTVFSTYGWDTLTGRYIENSQK